MRTVQREQLLEHLERVSELANLYATSDARFVDRTVEWLKEAEETFQRFRIPSASMAASERGKILSVRDGNIDAAVVDPKTPRRKALRVVACAALVRVEQEARNHVEKIDRDLDVFRDKIAQLLALASQRSPIPMPGAERREAWLARIWKSLEGGETGGMYNFVNASLPLVDRLYLLDEIVGNLLAAVDPDSIGSD